MGDTKPETAAMWICMKCDTEVDDSFDVCWMCGTACSGEEDPDFVRADEAGPMDEFGDYLGLEYGKKKREEELPEPASELVECFATLDLMEAQFVSNCLSREGITATVQNQRGDTAGAGMPLLYPPCVVVRTEDWPRARAWIEQYEHKQKQRLARHDRTA
jgi:hypothetical protein